MVFTSFDFALFFAVVYALYRVLPHRAQNVMLLAERGGVRNLGLAAEAAFAYPHEARVLRYELDAEGTWQPTGRYDVGHYDRKDDGPPYVRANSSGGAS